MLREELRVAWSASHGGHWWSGVDVAPLTLRFATREDACAALMRDIGPLARVGQAISHDLRELVDRLDCGDGAVELPARVLVAVARSPTVREAPCLGNPR